MPEQMHKVFKVTFGEFEPELQALDCPHHTQRPVIRLRAARQMHFNKALVGAKYIKHVRLALNHTFSC